MVRNAMSMQNLRNSLPQANAPSGPTQQNTSTPLAMNPQNQAQALQTLGNPQSMQLYGNNPHTKALMTRIAMGTATEADHWEFNNYLQQGTRNFAPPQQIQPPESKPSCEDFGIDQRSSPEAREYWQRQMMLTEQENRKWNQEQPARGVPASEMSPAHSGASRVRRPEAHHTDAASGSSDYQLQLQLLEEQNRRRLALARQEQEHGIIGNNPMNALCLPQSPDYAPSNPAMKQEPSTSLRLSNLESEHHSTPTPIGGKSALEDYQTQLMDLERQNKARLFRTRAEEYCDPFCEFLKENPTVFHAVESTKQDLLKAGWTELSERDAWDIKTSGRYFVERNGSSLIAFEVGANYEPGNGAAILAGHVDAITAKLKPVSEVPNKEGYLQLGVAPYAGGMNETWWDRDLGIGGRVLVKEGDSIKTKLVKLDRPVARIPTLAPHFGAAAQGPFNKETQMTPIIGLEPSDSSITQAQHQPIQSPRSDHGLAKEPLNRFVSQQPPALVRAIGNELGLNEETYHSIVNWELELYDTQPATRGGLNKEFIYAGRIDDKLCSWAAMQALTHNQVPSPHSTTSSSDSSIIKMVAWFDDEEIGSQLRQGARSNFLPQVLSRAVYALSPHTPTPDLLGRTYANSFLLSSDVTHAVNPNFSSAYLASHAPRLNTGLVIAADPNGHMTTDAISAAILQRCAEKVGATLQVFQIRNDSRSGGTVGPMLSSMTGIRAIDAGLPQLSMHSIRATTGALDPGLGVLAFRGFLEGFESVDREFRG